MKKDNNIRPTGLKGNDQVNRMKDLMGISPINETVHKSVVELAKLGPDGIVYGIVRENHKYFIKTTNKRKNLIAEDFHYIGGLQNKNEVVYESYAKAIKQLNLKFMSIREALGSNVDINVFRNDNLIEAWESYSEAPKPSQPDTLMGTVKSIGSNDGHDKEIIGDNGETGNPDVSEPKTVKDAEVEGGEDKKVSPKESDDDVELTEDEKAIDKMIGETRGNKKPVLVEDKVPTIKGGHLKIGTALKKINEGIASSKKKV